MSIKGDNIIILFRKGHIKTFEKIYRQHHTSILLFARSFVSDKQAAEDIATEVFRKLWELKENMQSVSHIAGWLKITTKNDALNYLATVKRREDYEKEVRATFSPEASEFDIFQNEVDSIVIQRIVKEINALPKRCRDVFILKYIGGLKSEEIAQKMKISPHTVRNQVQRALNLLRIKLIDLEYLTLLLLFLSL